MQLYTTVFPPAETPIPNSSDSLESGLSSQELRLSYSERLSRQHAQLSSMSTEIFPPSRPSSPMSNSRSERLKASLIEAIKGASADVTHPKWNHVSSMVRMACTSRGFRGAATGVRVGETVQVKKGDYEFVIPEEEKEWEELELKWKNRIIEKEPATSSIVDNGKVTTRTANKKPVTSKYWPDKHDDLLAVAESQEPVPIASKADRVRAKVARWQAKVVDEDANRNPEHPRDAPASQRVSSQTKVETKRQSPLTFQVMKHLNAAGKAGPSNSVPSSQKDTQIQTRTPTDAEMASVDAVVCGRQPPSLTPDNNPVIADLSEMSFLPPSFPGNLQTSTPQHPDRIQPHTGREKPPPILPRPSLSSPSHLPQSFVLDASLPNGSTRIPLAPSSSSQNLTTPDRAAKRSRPLTPPDEDVRMSSSAQLRRSPPPKKQKLISHQREHELPSSAPPPPSTPPLSTTPLSTRSRTPPPIARSQTKDLGNAKGLPLVPTTPDRQALPTLTELLASSRRSKPRPRPPSRKLKSTHTTPHKGGNIDDGDDALSTADCPRDSSPVRTYFSSPASGSSSQSSPMSTRDRPCSPVSPLLKHSLDLNMRDFVPPFASTQQRQDDGSAPFTAAGTNSQGGANGGFLSRAPSGFFGMGYSSQFDVEAQIGQVTALLEKDVDFDGWLKDLSDEEVEVDGEE
ncbi:hypothetical protein C8Q75DRAFT_811956 [Abortiporus biennis]|nr:hypothetical protein C8Q75DRAFT_811956 [Abortiporus biennis]